LNAVKKLIWPLVIIGGVTLADQLTKVWAVANLTDQPSRDLLGTLLRATLVYNDGGAMGTALVSSNGYMIISLILLPILGYYLWRARYAKALSLPLAFIMAGALGNLIDRIRVGRVIDFVDVDIPDVNVLGLHLDRWWTFNIADAAISCALTWVVIYMLFHKQEQFLPESETPISTAPPAGE
jgi:signal peptidase II